jgi:flagellar motor switch/type III secretory pathway protein FliN
LEVSHGEVAVFSNSLLFQILLSRFWSSYCLHFPWMTSAAPLTSAAMAPAAKPGNPNPVSANPAPGEPVVETALVATAPELVSEGSRFVAKRLGRLPVELDVSVPVRNFRVRNLLTLEVSKVIESEWGHGEDVPLAAGKVQLAWTEFEVIDTQLAVRVTRLV